MNQDLAELFKINNGVVEVAGGSFVRHTTSTWRDKLMRKSRKVLVTSLNLNSISEKRAAKAAVKKNIIERCTTKDHISLPFCFGHPGSFLTS